MKFICPSIFRTKCICTRGEIQTVSIREISQPNLPLLSSKKAAIKFEANVSFCVNGVE